MPTPSLMTWIPAQRRWTIRYMGRRYYVSCRQLAVKPETKEASIQAANAWWRDKQSDIDAAYRASQRTPGVREQVPAAALGSTDGDLLAVLQEIMSEHFADPPAIREDMVSRLSQLLAGPIYQRLVELGHVPELLAAGLPPSRVAQLDRGIKEIRGEQVTTSRTVGELAAEWLAGQCIQAEIGNLSAGRYATMQSAVKPALAFLGETADVSAVNAESLEGFYNYCLSRIGDKQWSRTYAWHVFSIVKQWINWLVGRGTIPAPSNFRRQWRFGQRGAAIATWTAEDIRKLVDGTSGKLRLCALLMVNCGMTQQDVSDLQDSEVNWRDGRIIRKRSKTRGHKDVPTVNYPLWPTTFALLQEHRSGKERVLLTRSGRPCVNKRMVDGRARRYDYFGASLREVADRLEITPPIKGLRKTSATLLESHEVYGRYAQYFLGHAPQSIADRHYVVPSQDLFDRAVMWIGEKLGLLAL